MSSCSSCGRRRCCDAAAAAGGGGGGSRWRLVGGTMDFAMARLARDFQVYQCSPLEVCRYARA